MTKTTKATQTTKATRPAKQRIPAEVKEWLPKEAKQAMRTGGEWDGMPDSASDGPQWYFQDSDDGRWYSRWFPTGYVVEAGKLYFRVMDVDSDGNWEFEDEAEVGTPEAERLEQAYGHEEWLKTYNAYLAWVAKHGQDPMNEFFTTKATIKFRQQWQAHVDDASKLGVELIHARPVGGRWTRPEDLPHEVKSYLALHNRLHSWFVSDYQTLAALAEVIAGSSDLTKHRAPNGRGGMVVGFSLTMTRPNKQYRKQLIARAKASLKK